MDDEIEDISIITVKYEPVYSQRPFRIMVREEFRKALMGFSNIEDLRRLRDSIDRFISEHEKNN